MNGKAEPDLSGALIRWNVYDRGKYVTLTFVMENKTFATVSLDYSRDSRIRAVIGYAEGGRNYYWDMEVEEVGENQAEFRAELYSDALQKGFRNAKSSTPVLQFSFTSTALPSLKEVFTTGMFSPSNGMDSILFTSTLSLAETPTLTADLYFSNAKENTFSVIISADNTPVDMEEKTVISSYSMSESGQMTSFTGQLAVNFLRFYSLVKEVVPADYQEILYSLFQYE